MANPILFKVTEAGKQALASGVVLSHIAVGAGKYVATGNETAMQSELSRSSIASGGVEVLSEVLRFSAIIGASTAAIYELGVITDSGVLFAIATSNTSPFFDTSDTANLAASFGLSLASLDTEGLTIASNSDGNQALIIMENHLADTNAHPQYINVEHVDIAPNPHEQYVDKSRLQALLSTVIPIGYLYHSHSDVNPKPLFDELLGTDTAWRRIAGKIVVAADPNDPFIETPQFKLGQKGATTETVAQRPNVYPLHTSHIWERYAPNKVTVLYDGQHNADGANQYQ